MPIKLPIRRFAFGNAARTFLVSKFLVLSLLFDLRLIWFRNFTRLGVVPSDARQQDRNDKQGNCDNLRICERVLASSVLITP